MVSRGEGGLIQYVITRNKKNSPILVQRYTESSFAIRLGEGAGGCFGAPSFAILRAIGNEQMRLPALVVTSFGLIDHGVVRGTLKSMKIGKIHKIHAPKFQGRVFSEVAEAPQAAPTRRTLVGDPEIVKK